MKDLSGYLHYFSQWLQYNPKQPFLFQTVPFVLLLSLFYFFYLLFARKTLVRNIFILVFSLFFYYKISNYFVGLLLIISFSDFLLARRIYSCKADNKKRFWLIISFAINIGALIYFKYTYFILDIFNQTFNQNISLAFKIIQPVGISYFVFKSLSYTIDVYREMIDEPERNYFRYLLYVSFFPNILAGPISKARDLMPQFLSHFEVTKEHLSKGIYFISLGLIKKIAVADFIGANLSDRVFDAHIYFSPFELLMAAFGGMLKVFFDFAGYSDIVMGIAFLLGFTIVPNFNQPFKAENISGFWKRWHMSFYNWLSDYVFQPIAFNLRKLKLFGTIIAIYLTFLISGLWHGPNITFVLWALAHGTLIAFESLTPNIRKVLKDKVGALYTFISIVLTFLFICFISVLINCASIDKAFDYYRLLFSGFNAGYIPRWFELYYLPFAVMLCALIFQYLPLRFYDFLFQKWKLIPAWIMALMFAVLILCLYQLSYLEAIPFNYIAF
jgi:alginate O-acetyltransferase complex protein AlgI